MKLVGQTVRWGFVVATLGLVAGCGSNPASTTTVLTPSQLIAASASNTLSQRTADVTISGSVTENGQTLPITGTGQVDMTSQSMLMNLNSTADSQPFTVREMVAGGQVYMDFIIGGTDAAQAAGYRWIEFPVSIPAKGTGGVNLFGSNPLAQLRIMEGQGATVRSLGTETLDSRTVQGYAVTPSRAQMEAGVKDLNLSAFSASEQEAIKSAASNEPVPTENVWIDSSKLVRQLEIAVAAGASTESADVAMDFTQYGTSIPTISAPAPSQVMSFANFLKFADEQANSGS